MTMMGAGAHGRSRGLRVFAIGFAILQIFLQGAFPVSDGYAGVVSSHLAPVHAEAPGNTHHRLHTDDCVVCHVIAAGSLVPPRAALVPPVARRRYVAPTVTLDARPYTAAEGARLARAPPTAV
jgi:hypothetical protein